MIRITKTVIDFFPKVQAIYLFGSWGTEAMRPDSDVDIAILLPHTQAESIANLQMSDLHNALEQYLMRDVDLINLRKISTVFQKEIITDERRIYCADHYAVEEFEMLTASFYQKLNEERAGILEYAQKTGRLYHE